MDIPVITNPLNQKEKRKKRNSGVSGVLPRIAPSHQGSWPWGYSIRVPTARGCFRILNSLRITRAGLNPLREYTLNACSRLIRPIKPHRPNRPTT